MFHYCDFQVTVVDIVLPMHRWCGQSPPGLGVVYTNVMQPLVSPSNSVSSLSATMDLGTSVNISSSL